MDVKLRKEGPEDTRTVECLLREAFWNVYVPGCEEHYLAHILRKHRDFVPELDLVAEAEGRLVGNVMCTHARIMSARETAWEMLCLGPLGVLPEYQQYGVGRILVERVTTLASEMGLAPFSSMGTPLIIVGWVFCPVNSLEYETERGNGRRPCKGGNCARAHWRRWKAAF